MHNNDRTHPVPDFLHMERIHYLWVSSSVSSYGWMKLCFVFCFVVFFGLDSCDLTQVEHSNKLFQPI